MRIKATARVLTGILLPFTVALAHAQSRATCAFSESFPEGGLPADWVGLPTQVERLDADGNGTGEFTAPWQVGNAAQANAGGYFPVPDEPEGNSFAMANDDAPPCDCAMGDLSLFSPFFDLSGISAPALSYRVYHDGRPFNTHAWLEGSPDGAAWTVIETIPAVLGAWQQRTVDLAAFASGSVQLRFRYNDGGAWASGIAVDDICVFGRAAHDVSLVEAFIGNPMTSAFNTESRSLGYTMMPLDQQAPLALGAHIRNNGTEPVINLQAFVRISKDLVSQSLQIVPLLDTLAPFADTTIVWSDPWISTNTGVVKVEWSLTAASEDDVPDDNVDSAGYALTGPLQFEGNNAMALDNDLASTACGTDDGFSAGCRFEMLGGTSTVHGISVRFAEGTLPGSRVHALLMDASLNLMSSSASHVVSDEDLSLSFSGGSVYLPLDSLVTISAPQDVIALVRCLPDSGAMRVACGGAVPQGAAFVIDAASFLISYPGTAPIVRIHLSDAVTGLSDDQTGHPSGVTISPNPADEVTTLRFSAATTAPSILEVFDAQGRRMHVQALSRNTSALILDAGGWVPGIYLVRVSGPGMTGSARLLVE